MDIGWCNYELGRFYDGKRKIVCIKNTDIPQPPPAFQPYQAYDADEAGILEFIDELFVSGISPTVYRSIGMWDRSRETFTNAHKVSQTNWHRNSPRRGFGNSFTKGELYFPYVTTRRNGSTPRRRQSKATPMALTCSDSARWRPFPGRRFGNRSAKQSTGPRSWKGHCSP